jgi:hypothetical protein
MCLTHASYAPTPKAVLQGHAVGLTTQGPPAVKTQSRTTPHDTSLQLRPCGQFCTESALKSDTLLLLLLLCDKSQVSQNGGPSQSVSQPGSLSVWWVRGIQREVKSAPNVNLHTEKQTGSCASAATQHRRHPRHAQLLHASALLCL